MTIYFAGSIRGGRTDKDLYAQIITILQAHGEVLTEHVGEATLSAMGEDGPNDSYIYERDMAWLKEADVVVAEVSTPSLGVGYEIGQAEGKKPVLCLYREKEGARLSAMLAGNPRLTVYRYTDLVDLKTRIEDFLQKHR